MTEDAGENGDDGDDSSSGRSPRFKKLSERVRGSRSESTEEPLSGPTEEERSEDETVGADGSLDEPESTTESELASATSETGASAADDIDSWDWIDNDTTETPPEATDTDEPASAPVDTDEPASAPVDTKKADLGTDGPSVDDRSEPSVTSTDRPNVGLDRSTDSSSSDPPTDRDDSGPGRSEPDGDVESDDTGRSRRIWSGTSRDGAPSADETDADPVDAFTEGLTESDEYTRPDELSFDPGTSVLVQCDSQDDRKHAACTDLLGLADAGRDRNVLLVRYRKIHTGRLERIADAAARTKVISIGHSQPIPQSVRESVETVEINNPNDITRLGILVSGTVDDWADEPGETLLCYDSLNVLLEYKDPRSTFRFLHILLGTLDSGDAISHFHVDPLAGDVQDINTLKPLFDEVVSIDDMGVSLE